LNYWLLTTEYPPMHGGGISTYCNFTAGMLAAAGHAVTVFTQDDGVKDFIITNETQHIRLVHFNSNRDGTGSFLGYTARLSYAFAGIVKAFVEAEGKPYCIEAQDYLGIAYYLTQFKNTGYTFLTGIPIIITLHSPAFIYLEYNRVPTFRYPDYWTGEMEKQAIAAADALISPTDFLVQEIQKHMSLAGKKLAVIANPFQAKDNAVITYTPYKLVYYGKLSAQKGCFELLVYFKALWDEGFKYPLHMVGGGDIVYHPEQQTMQQVIEKKYGPYIKNGLLKLTGKISPSQIEAAIGDAHVVIVPSIVDNMPYVVMEAMCLGKVVLASMQGGQAEMIDDAISGFLFDHEMPGTFAAQLNKILSLDEAAVKTIGANAKQSIQERYSFANLADKKMSFIELVTLSPLPGNNFPFLYQQPMALPEKKETIKDLLSVVVPFYNMGDYIEESIQSVLGSSYENIELLIINDGSTDIQSIKKIAALGTNENMVIVHQANMGLAATRNTGAAMARGEYLAFLDADDKVAPSYYEKTITALKQNNNVFFAGAWVQYSENSNGAWPAFTPQPPYALVHNPINSSGLVYKRNAFLTAGLNDSKTDYGLEDYESMVSMLAHGFNGVVLPELLFYYRVRTGSMFRKITKEKLLYSNKYIAEKHKDYYNKFAVQIINLLNANGPGYMYDNPTFEIQVISKSSVENMLLLKLKNFVKQSPRLKKIALNLKRKLNE